MLWKIYIILYLLQNEVVLQKFYEIKTLENFPKHFRVHSLILK